MASRNVRTLQTLRVTEIPQEVDETKFLEVAKCLSSKNITFLFSTYPGNTHPVISFASQFRGNVGTITLPSARHKAEAVKNNDTGWEFDDKFSGVTVLYSPAEPDLDICAVHGLNGNAFETWVAPTNHKMWLRDLLPGSEPFHRARIMTFGYSSQLLDKANRSGMSEWAHHLLVCVSSVRESLKERKRPILFVCHSMGGLVARQAMIRLNEHSSRSEYQGIDLKLCGLLFLGTPHSGSLEADWNTFLVDIAELTWGLRSEILDSLRTFNPMSTYSQEDFGNIKNGLPFDGFYETVATRFVTGNRIVVTRQSASLNGQIASPMADVDHNTICKFESRFGGFMQVTEKLRHLREILLNRASDVTRDSNKPWDPPPTALNCYLPCNKKFFEGLGLRQNCKLKGRESELKRLKELVGKCQETDKAVVAITGIGGIGKTETLLEIAHQQADQRNIFFVHANDEASLHQAYLHIAKRVGPEYLLKEYKGQDLQRIWSDQCAEDKVERFKSWLNDPENAETLFLLDDLDGLQDTNVRRAALLDEAKNILFTTRDPVFRKDNLRSYHVRLPPMEANEIIKIMEDVQESERDDYDENGDIRNQSTLLEIANAVHGHPLAASNAIKYIIRVGSQYNGVSAGQDFVAMLHSSNFDSRKQFLDFRPQGPSIMDTFRVSQARLLDPDGRAWVLMQLLSILETNYVIIDFREFLFSSSCRMDPGEFPDHDILGASRQDLSVLLGQIEAVSFGERLRTSEPFQFHPLWFECTRHAMGSAGRLRYTRQVLLICYHSIITGINNNALEETITNFLPHVRHCLRVCETFKIELCELKLPKDFESLIALVEGKGESGGFESPGVVAEGKGKGKELESQMDLCMESSTATAADESSTLIVNHREGEGNNEYARSRKKRRRGNDLGGSIQDGSEDATFIEYQLARVLQHIGATKDWN